MKVAGLKNLGKTPILSQGFILTENQNPIPVNTIRAAASP
jgi:hypothetical protein